MTTQRGLACLTGAAWGSARGVWRGTGDDVTVTLTGSRVEDAAEVRNALRMLDAPAGPTLFMLSYEACVALDPRLPRKPRSPGAPDVLIRSLARVESVPLPGTGPGAALKGSTAALKGSTAALKGSTWSAPDDAARVAHEARIGVAHERLLDGVIYQANLAHRLVVEHASHDEGLAFFRRISAADGSPPPCAAFVDVPGWGSVISLSPERFVARTNGIATTWPIKGTRPRGATPEEDARLLAELCASEKDAAEHVMIVDLLRNDLGKVAIAAGVTVERLLDIVSVKNVHHLESTIVARLRAGVTNSELLAATVPGGSITGAPKSSAVEVIHELEAGARGLYTGVLGVAHGDEREGIAGRAAMTSSLLIRTWLRPDQGDGSLHVGGGIVVDSDAASEWQETLDKARAFR